MTALLFLVFLVSPMTERARLDAHFTTVEQELRGADTSALTPTQRERRAALIDDLVGYRARGKFPRNLNVEHETPIFIDDLGVRCAMAHLIESHGGAAFVARVATRTNFAYIAELATDPTLQAWLDANGLTSTEAARIQPTYPRQAGQICDEFTICGEGTCEVAADDTSLSFCSPECAPGVSVCPIGLENIAMECQARGDRFSCGYPAPSPGGLGWPCNPSMGTVSCRGACASDDDGPGVCAPLCSNSQSCPADFECLPKLEDNEPDRLRVCHPVSTGCSTTTPSSLLLLLALPIVLRRRRAAGPRLRTSTVPRPTR